MKDASLPEPPGYFKVRVSVQQPDVKSGEEQGLEALRGSYSSE